MPSYDELNPGYTPPPGSRQNEQGYYVDAGGDFTPGEMTPGLWATLQSGSDPRVQWDAKGKPYQIVQGQKSYFSPNSLKGSTDPKVAAWLKTVPQPDGNFLHGYEWDPKTGEWKSNINGGNLLSAGIAGVGGGELLYAGLAGGGAAGGSGAAAEGTTAGTLPSTSTVGALGTLPDVAASGAVPGAVGGTAGTAGSVGALSSTGTEAGTGASTGSDLTAADQEWLSGGGSPSLGSTGGSMGGWASLAKQWAPELIGAGTQLIGSKMAADANTEAAKIQAAAADKALQWQKDLYGQYRTDTSGYRASGQGSVGKLSYLLGVPGFEGGPLSRQAPEVPIGGTQAPQAMTSQPPGTPGPIFGPGGQNAITAFNRGGQMVTVRAPTGETRAIPQSQLQKALSLGAQQVG